MTKSSINHLCLKLILLALPAIPEIAGAQTYFTKTGLGDLVAGFRKTGSFAEANEMVVYLGNITNFLALRAGSHINISNYTRVQITNECPDNLGNLQWSVFSAFEPIGLGGNPWVTAVGSFPKATCWYTLARTNASLQSWIPVRYSYNAQGSFLESGILGVSTGGNSISTDLSVTNKFNNTLVVTEPVTYADVLTTYIGDRQDSSFGDFGGECLAYSVENTTSNDFTAPAVSDLYQSCSFGPGLVDPFTGLTNGNCYWVGYFTLKPDGTMNFTRAFGLAASVTNGSAPLKIVFSTTATNTPGATNWIWNFGNGTIVTNTSAANITNTFNTAGSYTVTLTINGPNGPAMVTLPNYIVASSTTVSAPVFSSVILSNGELLVNGTNGTPSTEYRILMTTNLTTGTWAPVFTNEFPSSGAFGYTNSLLNGPAEFYRVISP